LVNEYNLIKVIPDDLPTHTKGGSLDGLWTTLEVTSAVLKSELSEISDHSMIIAKLKIGKEVKRTIPNKVDEFITSRDIRNF
jgi:hypothetical protein